MIDESQRGSPSVASEARDKLTLQALSGLEFATQILPSGAVKQLGPKDSRVDLQDGWLWLHFNLSLSGASDSLNSVSTLPTAARDLLKITHDQQELHATDSCVYGVLADLIDTSNSTISEIEFIQFAITENYFISSSDGQSAILSSIQRSVASESAVSPSELFKMIIDRVIDRVDDYSANIEEHLDKIEEELQADQASDNRRAIGQIRRNAVRVHHQLAIGRSLIRHIEQGNGRNTTFSRHVETESLGQRLDWLSNEIDSLRERAHLLQEEVMLKTADQTNTKLQVLAIVATVFLPATLVAGIFGMNVRGLPLTENNYGFFLSMALLVGASTLIFWLLKRFGLLG